MTDSTSNKASTKTPTKAPADNTARVYPCPQCKKLTQWRSDNPWRPFCSERCKLIDLGDWASERHAIPGDPDNIDEFDEFDDPEA
ncbi:MAG: DNA gyrase inhibitor YacG [Alcanivorax sp.]|nr:DNA gyrase inhibitor YacG [Alcanivorax sp.]